MAEVQHERPRVTTPSDGEPRPERPRRGQPRPEHPPGERRDWLVSVVLPIEAASAAEAVSEFWAYVEWLGPAELPAFVSPLTDELALQAYLGGEPVNLDPEEDG